jgi:hypothetical protein
MSSVKLTVCATVLMDPGASSRMPVVASSPTDLASWFDQLRRREHRVSPCRKGGRACMCVAAGDGDAEPLERLDAGDDADLAALGLEDRALLDVQFEVGGKGGGDVGCGGVAEESDAGEFLLHRLFGAVVASVDFGEVPARLQRDGVGPDAGADAEDGEAGAFFARAGIRDEEGYGWSGERTHFVQFTTPTGPAVSTLFSWRTRKTSRPAFTPRMPS